MLLEIYFKPKKLQLLRKELEISIDILLITILHWLINKDCLKKQQNNGNKQKSAIVIIISNKIKAKQFIVNRF